MAKPKPTAEPMPAEVPEVAGAAGDLGGAVGRRVAGALVAGGIPYAGKYELRGRWAQGDYTGLRNAAWAVRNSRCGSAFNPLALRLVLAEAMALVDRGEPLIDVLEAFAELLLKP